jgi:branched-chain amino acid transport system substrate-binding protein
MVASFMLVGLISLTGCRSNNDGGERFKLGGTGPLTGGAAQFGIAVRNGAQIAVDEINAKGGAVQFDFRFEDDQHNAEIAPNAFNSLRDWGIQVSTLSVTTAAATATNTIANEARIFSMSPSASSVRVTEGFDNIFQMCFTDPMQGVDAANYIASAYPNSRVAIIHKDDCAYSSGVYAAFNQTAAARGINIVYSGTFADGREHDFNTQLVSANGANADVLFLPIYYTPASLILAQANTMGYSPSVIGIDGMDGILGLEGFDTSLAEGVILLTPFYDSAEQVQSFVTEYQRRHNVVPNQFAAGAYDVVYAIYEMLKAVDAKPSMSASEINDLLVAYIHGGFTFSGLTGENMTWNELGQVNKGAYAVRIVNGRYQPVAR